ncbi:PASTA domain-containing protein [Actinopolymorpha sp. NPDC004070]|uniref:PASTA domain-containing protein n=1 Tax=Actinopolymorpha sp. NPDC004070 TaxID=3154548 RepID=UPI0033A24810
MTGRLARRSWEGTPGFRRLIPARPPRRAGSAVAVAGGPAHRARSAGPGPSGALLPDLVGMGLQSAQEAARGAGFANLISHDALGRGRREILDRSWRVCGQSPAPGRWARDSPVDLGAVRLGERSPADD